MINWFRGFWHETPPPQAKPLLGSDGSAYWFLPLPPGWEGAMFAWIFPKGTRNFNPSNSIGNIKVIEYGHTIWYVDEIHIRAAHRQRGLATALLAHVLEAAKEADVHWILGFAKPFEDAEPGLNLFGWYETLGFRRGKLVQPGLPPHNIVLPLQGQRPQCSKPEETGV